MYTKCCTLYTKVTVNTMYNQQLLLYIVHCTMYSRHCKLYIVFTVTLVYIVFYFMYIVHHALPTVQCTIYNVQSCSFWTKNVENHALCGQKNVKNHALFGQKNVENHALSSIQRRSLKSVPVQLKKMWYPVPAPKASAFEGHWYLLKEKEFLSWFFHRR